MSTQAVPAPALTVTDGPGEVDHIYCCDINLALCGMDLTGVPPWPEFDDVCLWCDLEGEFGCPNCGAGPEAPEFPA